MGDYLSRYMYRGIYIYIERERDREREREMTMGDYLNNGRERWNITAPPRGLPDITVQNKFTNLLESKTRATTLLSVIGHAVANSCVEPVCFLDVCPGRSLFFVLAVQNPRSSHVILFKKAEREK
jgi:hypothetical protein